MLSVSGFFLFFISSNGIAPWSPIERTVVSPDSQLHFISQFMENEGFFPSALTDVDFLQFGLFWEFLTNLSPWQEKKSKVALMADRWMDKQDGK